jgi:hypothetical protein
LKRCASLTKNAVCKLPESATVFDKAEFFERFLKVVLGFLGLTGFLFSSEFCRLTLNPLKHWVLTHFYRGQFNGF